MRTAKWLTERAVARGKEVEQEMGCKASPVDHTTYVLEICNEMHLMDQEFTELEVAEVIGEFWET